MTSTSSPAAGGGSDVPRSGVVVAPPRPRWVLRFGLPALVVLGMAGLLAVAAGESLRPRPGVPVHPVVYDPSDPSAALVARRTSVADDGGGDDRDASGAGRFARRGTGGSVQAPGWLEADPFLIACTALADGVVEEMLVLEGEPVERGQVVARLVDEDAELSLREAEAELATRRAELAAAKADLAAARADWDEPVERERAIATAEARLDRIRAELEQLPHLVAAQRATEARLADELERARTARAGGAATDLEIVILEKDVEAQAAGVAALERRRGILEAQARAEEAELAAARRAFELRVAERRALDAATAAVARAEAAVRRAEAAVDTAALRLERMTIRAPITGFVQRRLKVPGDKVMLGMDGTHSAHLVHLYDPARIQVRVDVPLADAAGLFVGQACEVVVEVLPGASFRGEVTRVTHEADLQKNTLQAKVRVVDPSPLLRPEMLTRVTFLPEPLEPPAAEAAPGAEDARGARDAADGPGAGVPAGLRVPAAALDERAGAARLWLVRDRRGGRGTLAPVTVDVLGTDEELTVVAGDLRPGDLVADVVAAAAAGGELRDGLRITLLAAPDTLAAARPAPSDPRTGGRS